MLVLYRAFAPGVLDKDVFKFQTLQHMMRMTRTWDSTMSMIPKGGDTIWGGVDWSPEGFFNCSTKRSKNVDITTSELSAVKDLENRAGVNYGRLISFGKDVAKIHSSEIERTDFRVLSLAFFSVTLFIVNSLTSSHPIPPCWLP